MECLVAAQNFYVNLRTCSFQVTSSYLSFHDSLISIQNGFESEWRELNALAFIEFVHELNPMQT